MSVGLTNDTIMAGFLALCVGSFAALVTLIYLLVQLVLS